MRQHLILPNEISGYAFDPKNSWWASVVAEESTNLVVNPSFERWDDDDLTEEYQFGGFTDLCEFVEYPDVGCTSGRRCAKIGIETLDATLTYEGIAMADGVIVTPGYYTFSVDVYASRPGTRFSLTVDDGSNTLAHKRFITHNSTWRRYHVSYRETGSGSRYLNLTVLNTGAHNTDLYTDCWQFEAKDHATTYLDGDLLGFSDVAPYTSYFWHGTPHASPSTRRFTTGSGGRLQQWSEKGSFLTTSIVGLLMPPVEQRSQLLGNGRILHLGVESLSRDFTITGRIFAESEPILMARYLTLESLLRAHNTPSTDQMILRHEVIDEEGIPSGEPLDIVCIYGAGMQGSITNFYQMNIGVQFIAAQPFPVQTYETNFELALLKELEPNSVAFRDETGEFSNLGIGVTLGGVVTRTGFLADGRPVAFGNFTDLAGSGAEYGAIWDGTAWQEIPGTDSSILDIDDGFKLGYPLTVATAGGSVFEYDPIAETWTELGDGFIGPIYSIARDEHGDIWVGGAFEFADDGVTVFNNVAKWDYEDEVWEQLGEGLTDPLDLDPDPLAVKTVLVTNDGYIYFGGSFTQGVSASTTTFGNAVIRWDIQAGVYDGMYHGLNAAPNQLYQAKDGYVYATGPFTHDGTESYYLRGFARWNGYSWEEVYPVLKPAGVTGADGLFQDEDDIFWFYNLVLSEEDDLFIVEGLGNVPFFGWRKGVIYPPYIVDGSIRYAASGPGDRTIYALDAYKGVEITAKFPALNEIVYEGTAPAPLVIHLEGAGLVNRIVSHTTGGGIYARYNFLTSANEAVTIRSDTQRVMAYSNQRRNLYNRLIGGATNILALYLNPGINRISVLVTESDEADGWLTWRNRYQGIAGRLL